jgi:hypothetical protein
VAGSGRKAGWLIGLAQEFLWIAYSVITRQWGFLASAFAYGFVFARNYVKAWRQQNALTTGERDDSRPSANS